MKKVEAQRGMDKVTMGDRELENEFDFPYLGHHFQADGDALHAIEIRLAMASARFGQLHHIWSSDSLPVSLKVQLYSVVVCSILTHAHEAWKLNADVLRKVRGWNGRNLAIVLKYRLEDQGDPEYDLTADLRVRRLKWVGHILRKPESELIRQVLLEFRTIYPDDYPDGTLLMDAPPHGAVSDSAI